MATEYVLYDINEFNEVDLKDIVVEGDILFFGEVHRVDWIINLEAQLVKERFEIGLLKFVGMEYFNYRMDTLLEDWLKDRISWSEMVNEYSKGPEGFPLEDYKPLLLAVKEVGVPAIGVMPPRNEARKVSHGGLEAIDEISDSPISSKDVSLGYHGYKERILSMIPKSGPMAMLDPEKIVLAQAFKDEVIAYRVAEAYRRFGPGIVFTGYAHTEICGSASTRCRRWGVNKYVVVTSRDAEADVIKKEINELKEGLEARYIALKR